MSLQSTRKIIVAVAPVGTNVAAPAQNPLRPEEVAQDVIACAKAGASMVHLHVRDNQGQETEDLSQFSHTLDLIRQESDIIIQGSTGSLTSLTREQRCVSLNDSRVEVASLNMGSANLGDGTYINTLPDVRFWSKRMQDRKIVPELEVFEGGMIANAALLEQEDLLASPFHFNFCLDFPGPLPATPPVLMFLTSLLPEDSTWGVVHHGMTDFSLLAIAAAMGALRIRVGFEDSVYFAPGQVARTNAALVERIVDLVRKLGREIASPDEARSLLGITQS